MTFDLISQIFYQEKYSKTQISICSLKAILTWKNHVCLTCWIVSFGFLPFYTWFLARIQLVRYLKKSKCLLISQISQGHRYYNILQIFHRDLFAVYSSWLEASFSNLGRQQGLYFWLNFYLNSYYSYQVFESQCLLQSCFFRISKRSYREVDVWPLLDLVYFVFN